MAKVEPTIVTVDVHYANPGFDGASQDIIVVVDCPSDTVAINGGIVQSVADAGWSAGAATALANGGSADPGSAVAVFRAERVGGSDPANGSYPRPVDDGGSWQLAAHLTFPYWKNPQAGQQNYSYGMTVTYYAECL